VSIRPARNSARLRHQTFDVEPTIRVAGKHVFTYGGNFRINRSLTIAPGEDGAKGSMRAGRVSLDGQMRVVAARVDKFSSIDNAVFSPRVCSS
jgi:hypothetical protein